MIKDNLFTVSLTFIAAALCLQFAYGREGSPEQCRRLEERIEKYTELRRGGGSGSQMTAWKRSRSEAEETYRDYNCHEQGRRMIRITRPK